MASRRRQLILSVVGLTTASLFAARGARAQQPNRVEDSVAVERATLASPRVRALVGPGELRVIVGEAVPDKAESQKFLEDTTAPAPSRLVAVVVFNIKTNRAARAMVSLPGARVLIVERLAAADVPFVRADAEEALRLAKANPAVRRAVGDSLDRFTLRSPGEESSTPYAAEVLPVRAAGHDPCATNRCLDLIFRTPAGYLSVRAHVDLTRRTVTVEGRARQ